jgi:hypothetical protein
MFRLAFVLLPLCLVTSLREVVAQDVRSPEQACGVPRVTDESSAGSADAPLVIDSTSDSGLSRCSGDDHLSGRRRLGHI